MDQPGKNKKFCKPCAIGGGLIFLLAIFGAVEAVRAAIAFFR